MRVLAICMRSYVGMGGVGGAERMLHSLLSNLVREGWSATASVFGRPRQTIEVDGVTVHRRRTDTDIADLVRDCDVIITHLGSTGVAKRLGKTMGKPVVQLIHNTNEYTSGYLGGGCDLAVYNSDWVKAHLERHKTSVILEPTSRTQVRLRPRVQKDWPSVTVRPPVTTAELGQPAGPDGFVTLVNLTPNKGPDVFYDLAKRNPDIRFRGVIGGYEENQQVIMDLPNVEIHPHTLDMDRIYSEASVVVMPSIYESYGLVAVEAMRFGVPVIASPTPGLQECLGSAGWFRDREDLEGWNRGLRWTLDNYDARSAASHERYIELAEQTAVDMKLFTEAMTGVCRGDYDNR